MSNFIPRFSRPTRTDNYTPLLDPEEQAGPSTPARPIEPTPASTSDTIAPTQVTTMKTILRFMPTVEDAVADIAAAISFRKEKAQEALEAGKASLAQHHQHVAHAMFAYNTVPRLSSLKIHGGFLNRIATEIECHAIDFVRKNHQLINSFANKDPQTVADSFRFKKEKDILASNTDAKYTEIASWVPIVNLFAVGNEIAVDVKRLRYVEEDRTRES